MPTTLKTYGNIRDHLTNIHLAEEPHSESTPSELHSRYVPSKEEIIRIANLIEKKSGMRVSNNIKSGEISFEFRSVKDAAEIMLKERLAVLDAMSIEKPIHDALKSFLKDRYNKGKLFDKDTPAFFHTECSSVCIIPERFEKILKEGSVVSVREGLVKGNIKKNLFRENVSGEAVREVKKFLMLRTTTHELVHRVVEENNRHVGYAHLEGEANELKLLGRIAKAEVDEKDFAKSKILHHAIKANRLQMNTLHSYNEAIAYYIGFLVMCELGYSTQEKYQFERTKISEPEIAKVINFFEAVQSTTHQNPVAFTIRNPPQSMQEIENHKAYLRRTRGWKV
jgi:hypothetical protein